MIDLLAAEVLRRHLHNATRHILSVVYRGVVQRGVPVAARHRIDLGRDRRDAPESDRNEHSDRRNAVDRCVQNTCAHAPP